MKLNLSYTPENDAKNYLYFFQGKSRFSYGRKDLLQRLYDQAPEKIKRLSLLDPELGNKIADVLKDEFEKNKKLYQNKENLLSDLWEESGQQITSYLSFIYQKPFPFMDKTLIGKFTTLGTCPFNYDDFSIYISIRPSTKVQIRTVIHELNHFIFYYYYSELKNSLSLADYELLRESLTYFVNPEDKSYPAEKALRKMYSSTNWKSIDEAIREGALLLKNKP